MKKICRLLILLFLQCCLLSIVQPIRGFAGQRAGASATGNTIDSLHDGQHDFDFNIGNWKTHIRRLVPSPTGPASWVELNGTVTVRKIWNGRAQVEEIEADGPGGHFEGLTLFLYNPTSRQWSQNFASSTDADISGPTIGGFKNGRGELFGQETSNGRTVLVRGVWSDISPDSHSYTESFTDDGGKTWDKAFIGDLTRDNSAPALAPTSPSLPSAAMATSAKETQPAGMERNGQHDFDFVFGAWKEHSSRVLHPLSGSTAWTEMDGTSVASGIWNGRGNLTELESDGPDGHLELLALRLYNPRARQWYLTFATSKVGILGMPQTIGGFKNGRGEFYDQELFNGRAIWVRFTIIPITPDSFRSEQAFSDDAGKTWETNWINTYTRVSS